MKTNEYVPFAHHKTYKLTIEISDDTNKVRFKGDADSKCSGWRYWNFDAIGKYVLICGERMYFKDFINI